MTRGELVFSVSRKLGLDDTAGSDERALMDRWANDAVRDTLLATHCHVSLGDLPLQNGVKDYRLDPTILAILDGTISTATHDFEVVTADEILDWRRGSTSSAGTARVAINGDLVMIWPTPTAPVETVRFHYIAKPSPMTSDSHDPTVETYGGIPEEYHRCLEYYMLWQGAEYDDKQAAKKPEEYLQDYERECAKARKRVRQKAGRRLTAARIGIPSRGGLIRRNDVYPA